MTAARCGWTWLIEIDTNPTIFNGSNRHKGQGSLKPTFVHGDDIFSFRDHVGPKEIIDGATAYKLPEHIAAHAALSARPRTH
jgi:hypothetical protein